MSSSDRQSRYSDPVPPSRNRGLGKWFDRRLQKRVLEEDLDFSSFFLKVYRFPFNTWASLNQGEFGYVMRFEHLQEEFSYVLERLDVEQSDLTLFSTRVRARKTDFATYVDDGDTSTCALS